MRQFPFISHGKRNSGPNPGHTAEGFDEIQTLAARLKALGYQIECIIAGSGWRFQQISDMLENFFPNAKTVATPFLGCSDGLDRIGGENLVILDNKTENGRRVRLDTQYLGLVKTPGFDPVKFLTNLPDSPVLCGGREFLLALGLDDMAKSGKLYLITIDDDDNVLAEIIE
ncbi:MAG: hypothetical protein JW816_01465 [Candidatus Buchananbacteria bacterium]|nr:hypothetical protein [Candidatus Buchananbacteria bacterium]